VAVEQGHCKVRGLDGFAQAYPATSDAIESSFML
jgi:hypothetical protein